MGRWTDIATWRGPTVNQGGAMKEQRGVVVHIAEGSFEGTIAWQKNPDADVSSHFVVAKDGRIAQMVDTDVTAWTQRAGNGHWLSIENEGHTPGSLTDAQVAANAKILARAHKVYGVRLQIAVNPDGYGLGHHSMGCNWPAGAWGHCDCPGPAIIAQKPTILARAKQIVAPPPPQEDDMTPAEFAESVAGRWLYNASSVAGHQAMGHDSAPTRNPATGAAETLTFAPPQWARDLKDRVDQLAATPPGTVVVTDEQLERVLRKVLGSVDGAAG